MADSLNLITVDYKSLDTALRLKIKSQSKNVDPILVLGKPGIGKTAQITALAKEFGIGYKEIRLLLYDVAEIKGIPFADKETHTTKVFPTDLLPQAERDGERGILVLDEITSCDSQMRAAVLQLLDEKRALGEYKLPDGWFIVCLGNGPDDGGYYLGAEGTTLTRCMSYRLEPDYKQWTIWARRNNVHPAVIAFIEANPAMIHTLTKEKVEETDGACLFACPRSWTLASKILNDLEETDSGQIGLSEKDKVDFVKILVAGYVGEDVANLFAAMYELREKLVQITEIMEGKNPKLQDDYDSGLRYLLAESIAQSLKKKMDKFQDLTDVDAETMTCLVNTLEWTMGLKDRSGRASNDLIVTIASGINSIPIFADLFLMDNPDYEMMKMAEGGEQLINKVKEQMEKYTEYCLTNSLFFGAA